MTTELTTSCLDGISPELKSKLNYREIQIRKHREEAKRVLFELAKELTDARDDCLQAGSESTFSAWVSEKCLISRATAYRAIAVWERFGCLTLRQPVAKGGVNFAGFEDTALYQLAKPETPQRAIDEALKIAKRGAGLTLKEAKELVAQFSDSVDSDGADSPDQAADPSAAAETVEFQDQPLIVCPHCEADLSKNTTFDERIVFGKYQCPECQQQFEIYTNDENCIDIRLVGGISADEDVEPAAEQPPSAAAIICPLCESDETVWIPKTGGGQFIPSTYTCGECEEPFVVDEAGKVTRVVAAGDNSDNEPVTPALTAPTVPYTSEDDGETFQTKMPSIDLSAGPVDPPDLSDCETMKMGWRLHVQPIWLVADDANQRAMVAFVKDLL